MSDDQSELFTALDGAVPGALVGGGAGLALGVVSGEPTTVAAFVGGVGVLALVLGGLSYATAGSVGSADLSQYAGDREFDADDARRTALRLVGLGVGLALGAGLTLAALG